MLPSFGLRSNLTCKSEQATLMHRLSRPSWHVASTREFSDALDVSFARLSNWVCRRQWAPSEARHLYRLTGNKSLFRIDRVTEFLSGTPPEQQAHDYPACRGASSPTSAQSGTWSGFSKV